MKLAVVYHPRNPLQRPSQISLDLFSSQHACKTFEVCAESRSEVVNIENVVEFEVDVVFRLKPPTDHPKQQNHKQNSPRSED